MSSAKRPTSPHLTIYKPQLTSMMSIAHRLTGVALYAGTLMLVWWLWVIAYDPSGYLYIRQYLTSWFGRTLLMGWTFAFFYHLGNGVRHLFWDIGRGFAISDAYRSGWAVIAFSLIMTAIIWNQLLSAGE